MRTRLRCEIIRATVAVCQFVPASTFASGRLFSAHDHFAIGSGDSPRNPLNAVEKLVLFSYPKDSAALATLSCPVCKRAAAKVIR